MELTLDQLLRAMPELPREVAIAYLQPLNSAMTEFGIIEPLDIAHFLAQTGHETLDFRYLKEIWGPTESQKKYEGRKDLGNTEPGDGKKFRGRGAIQTTGRANYIRAAEKLGIDCVEHPELLEQPEHAFRTAGLYWKDHGLTELALADDIRAVTRKINGGYNGLPDREARLIRAKRALDLWKK